MEIPNIIIEKKYHIAIGIFIFLTTLLIFFKFKPLLFLIILIIFDRLMKFITSHTAIAFGFEHVTITAILLGYISNIYFGLFSTIVMMFMLQIRNVKFGFYGAGIDFFVWTGMVILSHAMSGLPLSLVAIILTSLRYIIFKFLMPIAHGKAYDLVPDTVNWFYQIFIIKMLSYLI